MFEKFSRSWELVKASAAVLRSDKELMLFPLISGVIFDAAGLMGMFTTLAGLFIILGIVVQFPSESFGKPLEEDATEEEGAIYGH